MIFIMQTYIFSLLDKLYICFVSFSLSHTTFYILTDIIINPNNKILFQIIKYYSKYFVLHVARNYS